MTKYNDLSEMWHKIQSVNAIQLVNTQEQICSGNFHADE